MVGRPSYEHLPDPREAPAWPLQQPARESVSHLERPLTVTGAERVRAHRGRAAEATSIKSARKAVSNSAANASSLGRAMVAVNIKKTSRKNRKEDGGATMRDGQKR